MKITEAKSRLGSQTDKLLLFLDAQPDDEVFTLAELQEKLQISLATGAFYAEKFRWKDYMVKTTIDGRAAAVWGNKNAIASFRAQLISPEASSDEN